jgi:ketosteroid isomerase-like protein
MQMRFRNPGNPGGSHPIRVKKEGFMPLKSTVRKRIKYGRLCLSFFLSLLLSAQIGCSDGGSSGSSYLSYSSYNMDEYFPLSSGWQTNSWTLFVDECDHDIGGVSTKAVVDTGKVEAYFWSNDSAGLRLHAVWKPENQLSHFSSPMLLADAVSEVGDLQIGTFTRYSPLDQETLVFSAEIVGLESVTTSAGTFDNCLTLQIHIYPAGSLPEDFGYETLWLAKNVGFVKSRSDENAYFTLFSKSGKTRQLISYHVTPNGLTAEEMAVKEAYKQWGRYWNDEDLTGIADMTHDEYYEGCRDRADALNHWDGLLAAREDYKLFMSIEDVIIAGDTAYVLREYLESHMDLTTGELGRGWGRTQVRLQRDALGDWKLYGDQMEVYPSFLSVYPRVTPGSTTFAAPVEITDCATNDWPVTDAQIAAVTVTGPVESGMVNVTIPWDPAGGWYGFWLLPPENDISRAKRGFYTFEVIDVNGNSVVYTDYLSTATPLDMPALVSPDDGATDIPTNMTFQWDPVAGANGYQLEVWVVGGDKTISRVTLETTYTATLDPGTMYEWRVRARYYDPNDGAEYDSESRSDFQTFSTSP